MSESKKTNATALDNKCPGCGAPIHFNPKLNKWKCEYCNSEYTLADMKKFNNASSDKNNEKVNKGSTKKVDNGKYVSYKCQNCGAEIIADDQTAATFCVYCGSTAILKDKLTGVFAPDYVIPFKKEKEEAIEAFKSLAKGRPLIPKDFISEKNIEKIKGVYIPFWLCDFVIAGDVNSNATDSQSWSSGDTYYTKTNYYKLYRTGSMSFKKVPVDGSTRFGNDIMNSLEPFDFKELVEYNHAYLSGFYAEKYDVPYDEASKEALKRALSSATDVMLKSGTKYYETRIPYENTLKNTNSDKKYALLPIWMVNVKYKDKLYLFAMNGQTGEIVGDIPLDNKKTTLWTFGIFLGLFLGLILASYLLFKFGGA